MRPLLLPTVLAVACLGLGGCAHVPPAAARGVADIPPATPAQERYGRARWPKSLFGE